MKITITYKAYLTFEDVPWGITKLPKEGMYCIAHTIDSQRLTTEKFDYEVIEEQ